MDLEEFNTVLSYFELRFKKQKEIKYFFVFEMYWLRCSWQMSRCFPDNEGVFSSRGDSRHIEFR